MLNQILQQRSVPDVMQAFGKAYTRQEWPGVRRQIVDLLAQQVYGITPPAPDKVFCEELSFDDDAYAGKARQWVYRLGFETPGGFCSFPFVLALPRAKKPAPVFLHISFKDTVPNPYLPAEEIIDAGFGFVNLCYEDVTKDANEFRSGIASKYPRTEGATTNWGKLGMWAFAASRVMDYLSTRSGVRHDRVVVVGHSRLGKTALWCAAQDERFYGVVSNDSGCAGAAITRQKAGERVAEITNNFPYWFCDGYQVFRGSEEKMPFDQHFLLAAIAPRKLYVSSAMEDEWADPRSEFLSCYAASGVYTLLGEQGLVAPEQIPTEPVQLHEGSIGYHLRPGTHYLSRADWAQIIAYFGKHV